MGDNEVMQKHVPRAVWSVVRLMAADVSDNDCDLPRFCIAGTVAIVGNTLPAVWRLVSDVGEPMGVVGTGSGVASAEAGCCAISVGRGSGVCCRFDRWSRVNMS